MAITPENMTIHMLIGHISRISKDEANKKSDALGVPQGFRNILIHLASSDGITQLELSKSTRLKPPTVSVALRKMEEAGLVSRLTDEEDMRKSLVSLTPKGREIVKEIMQVFCDHDRIITDSLDEGEANTLRELLLKVYFGLDGRGEK